MRTLSGRLTLLVGAVVLAAVLAVSLAGYLSGRGTIERQIDARVRASSATAIAAIDAYLAARTGDLLSLATGNLTIHTLSPSERTRTLLDFESAFGNNRYSDISLVAADGAIVASSTGIPDFRAHPDLLARFRAATKPAIADLTSFADQSAPVFVVYAPLLDDTGKRAGTLAARLQTAELADIVRTIPVDEHGVLRLARGGAVLGEHRGAALRPDAPLAGMMSASLGQAPGAVDLGLTVVTAVDRGAALAPVTALALRGAVTGLAIVLLALVAVAALARRLAAPLRAQADAARRLAAGDLRSRVAIGRGEVAETRELGGAFNAMADALAELMAGIDRAARTVSTAAGESAGIAASVSSGSEEASAALDRITSALVEVAAGARGVGEDGERLERASRTGLGQIEALLGEIATTAAALEQLRVAIETSNDAGRALAQGAADVAERAAAAGTRAEAATATAERGGEAVRRLIGDVRGVGEHLVATQQRLDHLAAATAGAIRAQLDVIVDIAERSKLLALNAGIEAARAGEQGRGFTVIAQELHRLAGGSKQAADEVTTLVGDVVAETQRLVAEAAAASANARAAVDRAGETGATIAGLVREIGENAEGARAIGAIAGEQAARSRELERATEEMRRMAETTGRAAREVEGLSRDVRGAVDLATQVATQVAGAVREQRGAFDVIERGAVEIQATTARVAAAAQRSSGASASLEREAATLVGTLARFGAEGAPGAAIPAPPPLTVPRFDEPAALAPYSLS